MLPCTVQALVPASLSYEASSCHSLVSQLSQISSYCGLSYLSLLTTYDVEAVACTVFGGSALRLLCVWSVFNLFQSLLSTVETIFLIHVNFPENKDDCMGCLSHVKHGAALSGLC